MAQIHIPGLRSFLMIFGIYGRLGEDIHRTDTCLVCSLKTKKSNVVQISNFTPWSVQPEKMQIIRRIGCVMFVHVSSCGQSWKQNFPNFGLCKATNTKIWPKQKFNIWNFWWNIRLWVLQNELWGPPCPQPATRPDTEILQKRTQKEHVERVSILVQFPYITVSFR